MKVGLAEKLLMKIDLDRFVDMDQVSEKCGKVCEVFKASAVLHQRPMCYHFRMKVMPLFKYCFA